MCTGWQMHSVDALIETYLAACEVEGKSPNTVWSYRTSLADFRRTGRTLGLPADAEAYAVPDVYRFLQAVRARGVSPAYQHRRHREVKAFFSWCRRMDLIQENVFARVPLVKLEQQIIQPFSAADIDAMLAVQDRTKHHDCRTYALILFLLDTGVRASECVSIRLDDVDWEHRRVRVLHGKGQKQRWVGIGERTVTALEDYIQRFRGGAAGCLFLGSRSGAPIKTAHGLHVIFQRIALASGVEGVHPHRFRHTFATWAIAASAREVDVQTLLGHSSMAMTQRYSRTYSSEQAVTAHAQFSPVAQLSRLE
jgi:integrase/recombinase XerC